MDAFPMALVFTLVVIAIIVIAILSHLYEKKRREELQKVASALGLAYHPGRNHDLIDQLHFLNRLESGSNRYAESLFTGIYRGQEMLLFDFHYETYSTDSKGNRTTHHHWHHVATLRLPAILPELTIGPENILTRLGKAFGYPSIDFESHEFSKAFLVQSNDKKFAYDICHTRAMEYLLRHPDLQLEIESDRYALIFDGRMAAEDIEREMDYLIELRALMPDYLFAQTT